MTLLVPRVLGIHEYSYWQLFIFYSNYIGFFHLGLNDGVYLINGGKTRGEIDRTSISSLFRFSVFFQLIVGVIIAALSLYSAPEEERAFVLVAFAIYMVLGNLASYLGYLFQAMNETRLFSFSVVLDRLAFFAPMIVMVCLRVTNFRFYVISYLASKAITLLWCCWRASEVIDAPPLGCSVTIREALSSIRVGFMLMIANVSDMLILGAARALVDAAWGIEAFGRVSLSLSLVNFFITFVTQASMVLFPALRQSGEVERRAVYRGMRDAMEVFFPAIYILYFPMVWILLAWLPQYSESLRWLAILLPVCVFNTKMDVCCTTYFKVLREERLLLAVNLATVAASIVMALVGVFVLNSLESVLFGAVCCIGLRSAWSELKLDQMMGVQHSPMLMPELVLTAVFVSLVLYVPGPSSLVLYSIAYGIYLALNRGELSSVAGRIKRLK